MKSRPLCFSLSAAEKPDVLVIFTADHGEMMAAHGYLTKGRFYEESVRVPSCCAVPATSKPAAARPRCR